MAPLSLFGQSFFLACCGSFMNVGDPVHNFARKETATLTDIKSPNTAENELDFLRYLDWIAPPRKRDSQNESLIDERPEIEIENPEIKIENPEIKIERPEIKIKNPEIEIDIMIPQTIAPEYDEKPADSNIIRINNTFLDGSNILQINIFNNGGGLSSGPKILKTQKTSDGVSEISLTPGDSPPVNNSFVPLLYGMPRQDLAEDEDILPWWKTAVIYQIYPRSFMDTSGSGTGDLKGITSKLDYLKALGVGAVWISPFYVSPMADFGYDVADFKNVDPIFGSLTDFDLMVEEMHKRGLKLILDFISNHSSDQHEWFQKSLQRIDPYTDYYVWVKPKGHNEKGDPIPPNNWLSVFGGSAWKWSPEREEFYLHQFLKEQPDLNVRNPLVMEELDDILRFWLDRGADGIRVDALKFLFEDKDLSLDDPVLNNEYNTAKPNEYLYLKHTFSVNQQETVEAVKRWRTIIDGYENERFMVVEVYDDDIKEVMKYYETPANALSHFPFNFYLITELANRSDATGEKIRELTDFWISSMPSQENWPNWVLGNHDRGRVASRLGKDLVDALNMFTLLLPGTPTTFYGEEIGMEDTVISYEEARDPFGLNFGQERYAEFGRDPARTPMQWDDTNNAGFSKASSTWLPVNKNFKTINVKAQELKEESHLKAYRQLTDLRKGETFSRGNYSFPIVNNHFLALKRSLEGHPSYLLLINTSESVATINAVQESVEDLKTYGEVVLRSSSDTRPETVPGSRVDLAVITLLAGEGLVLRLDEM